MDSMQKRFVTRLLGFTTGLLLFLIAAIKLVLLSGSPVRLHEFIQRHIMVVLEDQTVFSTSCASGVSGFSWRCCPCCFSSRGFARAGPF